MRLDELKWMVGTPERAWDGAEDGILHAIVKKDNIVVHVYHDSIIGDWQVQRALPSHADYWPIHSPLEAQCLLYELLKG